MPQPRNAGPAGRRRRMARVVLALCALAACGLWLALRQTGGEPPGPPGFAQQPVPVAVAPATLAPLQQDLHALGTITPLARADLRSQVDGELLRLHFAEGQAVAAGQLLAELDARPFRAALAAAEGELARTQALLDNAEADLRRYETLARQDAVAGRQLDAARAEARRYRAQRQRDQARVDEARRQLSHTRIVAPYAGRVGLRRVDAGNHVRAADAEGLVTLVQTSPISAVFSLPETRLDALRRAWARGAAPRVQAWDADERRLLAEGELEALDNRIETATGTVRLRARFANADESLFPNQFVNIRLILSRPDPALSIPSAAVQYGADGAFVFVIGADRRAMRRDLALGPARAGRVAVESGLEPAERVVVEGIDRLQDGREVLVVEQQG